MFNFPQMLQFRFQLDKYANFFDVHSSLPMQHPNLVEYFEDQILFGGYGATIFEQDAGRLIAFTSKNGVVMQVPLTLIEFASNKNFIEYLSGLFCFSNDLNIDLDLVGEASKFIIMCSCINTVSAECVQKLSNLSFVDTLKLLKRLDQFGMDWAMPVCKKQLTTITLEELSIQDCHLFPENIFQDVCKYLELAKSFKAKQLTRDLQAMLAFLVHQYGDQFISQLPGNEVVTWSPVHVMDVVLYSGALEGRFLKHGH